MFFKFLRWTFFIVFAGTSLCSHSSFEPVKVRIFSVYQICFNLYFASALTPQATHNPLNTTVMPEFRSVSSSTSQEVYIESTTSKSVSSSGMSSSRSMKIIEESASVNGRTVASSREVIGGGSGFSAIQEVSSGGITIEEISSKQNAMNDSSIRNGQARRRSSAGKPVFSKTIEGMCVPREYLKVSLKPCVELFYCQNHMFKKRWWILLLKVSLLWKSKLRLFFNLFLCFLWVVFQFLDTYVNILLYSK